MAEEVININRSDNAEGNRTLSYVIKSVMNRLKEYNTKNYEYYMQLAVEGLKELNIYDNAKNIEVAYLTMDAMNTVALPVDFIDYSKIGIVINGQVWTLTVNEKIALPRLEKCGEKIGNIAAGSPNDTYEGYVWADHFKDGQYVGGLYGVGGGFNMAYYRVDESKRRIIFNGSVPKGEIVLEYISSGIKKRGGTMIREIFIEPLRRWVLWQRVEHDNRVPLAEKDRKERQFYEAVEKTRGFENSFTADEYRDMLYSTTYQAPKR